MCWWRRPSFASCSLLYHVGDSGKSAEASSWPAARPTVGFVHRSDSQNGVRSACTQRHQLGPGTDGPCQSSVGAQVGLATGRRLDRRRPPAGALPPGVRVPATPQRDLPPRANPPQRRSLCLPRTRGAMGPTLVTTGVAMLAVGCRTVQGVSVVSCQWRVPVSNTCLRIRTGGGMLDHARCCRLMV